MFDNSLPLTAASGEPDQNQPQGGHVPPVQPSDAPADGEFGTEVKLLATPLLDEAIQRERVDRSMALVHERAKREALRADLLALGADQLEGHYDGYGDSGNVEDISATKNGEPIELPSDLMERLDYFIWSLGYNRHPGFENNEGGDGDVSWNLTDDTIELDHADRYVSTNHSSYEF